MNKEFLEEMGIYEQLRKEVEYFKEEIRLIQQLEMEGKTDEKILIRRKNILLENMALETAALNLWNRVENGEMTDEDIDILETAINELGAEVTFLNK